VIHELTTFKVSDDGGGEQKFQLENRTATEERLALERRRQAAEDAKANRRKAEDDALSQEAEETAALDNLLEKLRNGDNVGRRARRARPSAASTKEVTASLPPPDKDVAPTPVSAFGGTTADIARGMLEQLKTNGFVSESFSPISPTVPPVPRRRRLRGGSLAAVLAAELEAAGDSPPAGSPGIDNGSSLSAGPGTHNDYGSDTGRED
jgi:cytokinesis protein